MVLLAYPEVRGYPGDTVKLPCILHYLESDIPRVTQIRWERLEPRGNPRTVAEFHWVLGPRIPEPDHVQFVDAGKGSNLLDGSLTLTKLRPDDEANYTCEIITFLQERWRASTWVRVFCEWQ